MTDAETLATWIVNSCIVAYITFAWTWDLPGESRWKRLASPLAQPFAWMGLRHQWTMFAPNPIRFNDQLVADVYAGDHRLFVWSPSDPREATLIEGFLQSRENKLFEHLANGRYRRMRRVLAEHIAKHAQEDGSRPTFIVLRRLRKPIQLESPRHPTVVHDSILHIHRVKQRIGQCQ